MNRGTVWAVTMVRDEADVIEYTLEHLRSEGVDGFLIADNLSADDTPAIIRDWSARTGARVELVEDLDPAYYQSKKMTALANRAHIEFGADWIVPFDADECWYGLRVPLAQYLRGCRSGIDRVDAELWNHFPTSEDVWVPNPFERIRRRDRESAPLPKVCLRWHEGMVIHQGNHGADGWSKRLEHGIGVRHFPWRSPEQFETKIRNGYEAYKQTDLDEAVGAHWRQYGQILETRGSEVLREEVYEEWFLDPPLQLQSDPAPYCRWAR